MVLVREEQGLGKTCSFCVVPCRIETWGKRRFDGYKGVLLSLCAFVFGGTLGEFEYIGKEQLVVGIRGFVEELGALRVEFQRVLEKLQGFLDLR